jgi:hypothetical protein
MVLCFFNNREVVMTAHALKQAIEREIAYPDSIIGVIMTGKMARFGKNLVRFVKKTKKGSLICVGEELCNRITIRTVERGN